VGFTKADTFRPRSMSGNNIAPAASLLAGSSPWVKVEPGVKPNLDGNYWSGLSLDQARARVDGYLDQFGQPAATLQTVSTTCLAGVPACP